MLTRVSYKSTSDLYQKLRSLAFKKSKSTVLLTPSEDQAHILWESLQREHKNSLSENQHTPLSLESRPKKAQDWLREVLPIETVSDQSFGRYLYLILNKIGFSHLLGDLELVANLYKFLKELRSFTLDPVLADNLIQKKFPNMDARVVNELSAFFFQSAYVDRESLWKNLADKMLGDQMLGGQRLADSILADSHERTSLHWIGFPWFKGAQWDFIARSEQLIDHYFYFPNEWIKLDVDGLGPNGKWCSDFKEDENLRETSDDETKQLDDEANQHATKVMNFNRVEDLNTYLKHTFKENDLIFTSNNHGTKNNIEKSFWPYQYVVNFSSQKFIFRKFLEQIYLKMTEKEETVSFLKETFSSYLLKLKTIYAADFLKKAIIVFEEGIKELDLSSNEVDEEEALVSLLDLSFLQWFFEFKVFEFEGIFFKEEFNIYQSEGLFFHQQIENQYEKALAKETFNETHIEKKIYLLTHQETSGFRMDEVFLDHFLFLNDFSLLWRKWALEHLESYLEQFLLKLDTSKKNHHFNFIILKVDEHSERSFVQEELPQRLHLLEANKVENEGLILDVVSEADLEVIRHKSFFSPSELNVFISCPRKYLIHEIKKINLKNKDQQVLNPSLEGQWLHYLIALYSKWTQKSEMSKKSEGEFLLLEEFEKFILPYPWLSHREKEHLKEISKEAIFYHHVYLTPFLEILNKDGWEIFWEYPLRSKEMELSMRLDFFAKNMKKKSIVVIDFKRSQSSIPVNKKVMTGEDIQILSYLSCLLKDDQINKNLGFEVKEFFFGYWNILNSKNSLLYSSNNFFHEPSQNSASLPIKNLTLDQLRNLIEVIFLPKLNVVKESLKTEEQFLPKPATPAACYYCNERYWCPNV